MSPPSSTIGGMPKPSVPPVPIIDISYWNTADGAGAHVMDTDRLIDAGIRGVIVRAGRGAPDTGDGIDRHLVETVEQLEAAGLPYWLYYRPFDIWYEAPRQQARRFLAAASLVQYDAQSMGRRAVLMIDVEEWVLDGQADRHELGGSLVDHWYTEFRDELNRQGHGDHAIYTRASWWDGIAQHSMPWGHLPLYVAHWVRDSDGNRMPVPTDDANVWDEFVDRHQPEGPALPDEWRDWSGWQFAGEGSEAGAGLGFASQHLDCGLLRADVFNAWMTR